MSGSLTNGNASLKWSLL